MSRPKSLLLQERYKDAEFLHDWSTEVLRFVRCLAEQNGERTAGFDEMLRIAGEQKSKGRLRGLRSIFHDTRELAGGLNENEQRRLSEVLRNRFGADATYFKKLK